MKETKKRRYIVSTIMYGMILIFIQLPWVVLKGKNYSIYAAYFRIKAKGIKALSEMAASVWDGNLTIIRIQLILLIVFQIVIVLHIVTQWLHKEYYLNIAALVVLGLYIVVNESGFGMLADNSTKTILIPAIIMIFVMAEVLIRKMLDVWKDAKESAEIFAEKEREEKEEERRRLYFPGNYTKLFYQMVWHNFKYDWKDYGLLLFCGVIVSAFSFAGLGIYQMMAKAHRAENFLLGEGLGRILLNAMLPMAVCAIFLMVFVLVFYMKKWTQNYSVFVTLGIRKKALYTIIGIEIVVAFLCSLIAGGLLGNMIMFLLRKVIFSMLAKGIVLSKVTWLTYVKGTLVVVAVYIISLMATRDIVSDFNLVRASIRNIAKEHMPQRRTKLFITAGIIICMIAIFEYRQLRNHESMYLLFAFFAGIFLLIRFVGAGYLRRAKKTPAYLPQMLNRNHLYYKSKTTARYVLALTILNVCAVFYFLFQVVSVTIAEKPESLYPYDFVCIADDGDDAIFDRIKNGYQAKIIEYPMVRVANADKTEQSEGVQQGKRPLNRNHLYYKSKTTARYVLALTILNVCAVFYFLFQVVSVTIAEKPESLYPYDFVCIADDGDDAIFDRIKNGYQAKIIEYPMVRVANADKTEQNEGVQQGKRPQGQQIGISESTYKQLKKYVDPSYKEEAMHLDRNGKKVYLVHQQDRSVKAQPVDWTFGKKKPFLHIGLPCEYYTLYSPSKAYPKRTIEGEEIGSLIGCFRQGKLENIVVFSDAYFKKAQGMWKYTNILTGDKIEEKALRIDGVTIKQGPTKLVLIQADPKYQKAIEKKMKKLEKNHTYEAQYDFEVHCWYSKKTAVNDLKTEYTMKLIINTFVLLTMTISGLFLMYIKSLSEMSDKKARADFLKCMGMRKKERVSLLKRELYYFYWLPELITIVVTSIFTAATFHARMYTHAVRIAWLKHAVWIWLMYLAVQWGFAWILGRFIIRKVEGKDE